MATDEKKVEKIKKGLKDKKVKPVKSDKKVSDAAKKRGEKS